MIKLHIYKTLVLKDFSNLFIWTVKLYSANNHSKSFTHLAINLMALHKNFSAIWTILMTPWITQYVPLMMKLWIIWKNLRSLSISFIHIYIKHMFIVKNWKNEQLAEKSFQIVSQNWIVVFSWEIKKSNVTFSHLIMVSSHHRFNIIKD